MSATAGGGFANAQVAGTSGAMIAQLTATPSDANIDAVFGFASGFVRSYNDLAASVRFWTNGRIEARDGDGYRADLPISYFPGETYSFKLVIDIPTKTYSVFVALPRSPYNYIELARGYRFRPQQQTVTALRYGAAFVESARGHMEACAIQNTAPRNLALAREGSYVALPLSGGGALISDGMRTLRLDAAGKTTGELPVGGRLAVDAENGNIYIASAAGGTLTLSAYTPALARRWSRTYPAAGSIYAIDVYNTRQIAIAVGQDRPTQLIQIHQNGMEQLRRSLAQPPLSAIAIAPCGYALAYQRGGIVTIEARRPNGTLEWQRAWAGDFTVTNISRNPSGVAFAGTFTRAVDFGAGRFEPVFTPDGSPLNTYLVVLTSDGSLRYAKRFYTTYPTGVDINNSRVALATVLRTQMLYMEIRTFDAAGAQVLDLSDARPDALGRIGAVEIAETGRVYASVEQAFAPGPAALRWPFLYAFDPVMP